jgi:RsmE family RNA methyltransferase
MHFYIPNLKANILTEAEAAHLFVMRVQENKTYMASDLAGKTCKILITKVDKKSKTIEFEQAEIPKTADFQLKSMFQAIPDKVYLDKLCEVLPLSGVTDLFLFYSDNSIEYPINKERVTKILIRSCEQAQVAYLPKIVVLNKQDLDVELKNHLPTVLDCNLLNNKQVKEKQISPVKGVAANLTGVVLQIHKPVLIGPEGGWTDSEVAYFQSLNLNFASLGSIIYPAWIAGLVWEKLNDNYLTPTLFSQNCTEKQRLLASSIPSEPNSNLNGTIEHNDIYLKP